MADTPLALDLGARLAVRRVELLHRVHRHPYATDILLLTADHFDEAAQYLHAANSADARHFVDAAAMLRRDAEGFGPARAGDAP
jgi:hypothetical protein